MKSLVIYDTNFGNTKIIAEEIAKNLGDHASVTHIDNVQINQITTTDLLVIGCPIIAWNPTIKTKKLLSEIGKVNLKDLFAAAFDTRIDIAIHGDACKKMSKRLASAGCSLISEPKYFFVEDKEGPISDGELEKAAAWGHELKQSMSDHE